MAEKGKITTEGGRNTVYLIAAILVVIIVAFGIYYFTKPQPQPIVINNTPAPVVQEGFQTHTVDINNESFNPASITIDNGDTIVWINSDTRKHTITSDRVGELHSLILLPGENYTHQFKSTMQITYHCEVHPEYKGSVEVQ